MECLIEFVLVTISYMCVVYSHYSHPHLLISLLPPVHTSSWPVPFSHSGLSVLFSDPEFNKGCQCNMSLLPSSGAWWTHQGTNWRQCLPLPQNPSVAHISAGRGKAEWVSCWSMIGCWQTQSVQAHWWQLLLLGHHDCTGCHAHKVVFCFFWFFKEQKICRVWLSKLPCIYLICVNLFNIHIDYKIWTLLIAHFTNEKTKDWRFEIVCSRVWNHHMGLVQLETVHPD